MANDKFVKPGYMPADGMPMDRASAREAGSAMGGMKGPMNTNKGHHPGVKRISKHPMGSMTSKKGQQGKGCC